MLFKPLLASHLLITQWPKQITRPTQIQGMRRQTLSLDGWGRICGHFLQLYEAHVQVPITLNTPSLSTSSRLNSLPFVKLTSQCVCAGHMVAAALPVSRPRCRGALAAGSRRAAAFVVRDPARSAARRPPLSLTAARCLAAGPGRPARLAHEGAPRLSLPPARGGAALRRWRRCPLCGKRTASAPSPRAPWR